MLDRIEMDVVDKPLKIPFVTNYVFPKTALRERVLTVRVSRNPHAGLCNGCGEAALDQAEPA
jgi:hypothetical protein